MGVKGLWKLMLPIGRRISIETLSGQTLAIDASIWLTQFIKAMRDPETGKVAQAAHLIGFFRRICRLYYHEIRPVFVFDGATPEIKRKEVLRRKRQRDVFASNFNDMTVQRIAKKLLSNNIHKAKLKLEKGNKNSKKDPNQADAESVGGGAYAEGFNPGAQRQAPPVAVAANRTIQSSAEDQKELEAILAEEPDVKKDDTAEVNDWDLPLAVAAAEEAKEIESEEEYHLSRAGDDGFITEVVASLPSHKRKDAIEKAHRAQRMRSRREFMPAAAKPQDFSNVQVKNFLRYCKLNQDIVSMAKKAASQEGADGKAMASDLTTRIELVHESEEEEEAEAEYESDTTDTSNENGPKSLLKEKLGMKRRRRDALVRTDSNSSNESWGGSVTKPQALCKSPRKSTVLYDSDESVPHRKQDRESSKNLIHIQDSSSEDDAWPNGAPAPAQRGAGSKVAIKNPPDTDSTVAQELEDHQLALVLHEEEDQYSSRVDIDETTQHDSDPEIVVDGEDPKRTSPEPLNATLRPLDSPESQESSSDESIDWEDGENPAETIEATATAGDALSTKAMVAHPIQEAHKTNPGPREAENDTPIDPGTTGTQENSAALQQAQETASHLANWAGRAFKRAMKEAGQAPSSVDDAPCFSESSSAQSTLVDNNGSNSSAMTKQIKSHVVQRGVTMQRPSIPSTDGGTEDFADLIDWSSARNRQERDRDGLTDEMLVEAKQMLQLFGIP